jgi:electron transport complex protein RnfG
MIMTIFKMVILAIVCGLLLSTTHLFSEDQIKKNQQDFELQQLQSIIGNQDITLTPNKKGYQLWKAGAEHGQLKTLQTQSGYNGEIRFWLATTLKGEIIGVRVIDHQETPGLGDKLELSVSNWILGFNGTSLATHDFEVKKYAGDFDQFSGATITPRAIVMAVADELSKQLTEEPTEKLNGETK